MEQETQLTGTGTIVAVATPAGTGGIAVIRLSGADAFEILSKIWKGKDVTEMVSHSAHLGRIIDDRGETVDQVVVTAFRAPNSFTGENVAEISCHGSAWIQRRIVNLLIEAGANAAGPGEFTQRAFLNGRLDLAQAEAVADLISASSRAAHRLAMAQVEGTYSSRLSDLRSNLVDMASLLELELDFSEEDVEFAERAKLSTLARDILGEIGRLAESYAAGKVFRDGIPVVIAGEPNAGKSTLLNRLLEQEKAIVSDVPGTTRDIIEDTVEINGVLYRFIDTAGLRDTEDVVERIGIERATRRIRQAQYIIWVLDPAGEWESQLGMLRDNFAATKDKFHIIAVNKQDVSRLDASSSEKLDRLIAELRVSHPLAGNETSCIGDDISGGNVIEMVRCDISAENGTGIEEITGVLSRRSEEMQKATEGVMVTNARHYAALLRGKESMLRVQKALEDGISADLIAQDLREALHTLGEITGTVTTDTLLHTIFSRFCIGK